MGWFESAISNPIVQNVVNPLASVGQVAGAIGGQIAKDPKGAFSTIFPVTALANGITGGAGKDGASGTKLSGANAADRNADLESGYKKGREIFYDDPDMQALRAKREDLAKGYSGKELGALKAQAVSDVEGARSSGIRKLQGNLAKAGVGGARAAAIQASADKGYAKDRGELERKMLLDSSSQVRSGTKDLQDFIFGQKYGELGTGLGYGQLGVSDRSAANQAAIANAPQKRGLLGGFLEDTFGGLF